MAQEFFLDPPKADVIKQWKFYLEQLDLQPNDKILDVGCNTGEADLFLLNSYPYIDKVIGIDNSQERVDRAKKVRQENGSSEKLAFTETAQTFPLRMSLLIKCYVQKYWNGLRSHKKQLMKSIVC